MPRGRYQQQQWEARRSAILHALEQLSGERGFSNVTMDDLADRVGISKATLYQHFESKEAMLVELMASHEDAFIASLEAMAGQPANLSPSPSAAPKRRRCRAGGYEPTLHR